MGQKLRFSRIHPPNSPWRGEETKSYSPHQCLGQQGQCVWQDCHWCKYRSQVGYQVHHQSPHRNNYLRRSSRHLPSPSPLRNWSFQAIGRSLHPRHPRTARCRRELDRSPRIHYNVGTERPHSTTNDMDSDAGIFLRREIKDAATNNTDPALNPKRIPDGTIADIMMHCYQIPFCLNTARLGYEAPLNAFCMTPNIPRPRSRGRIYLTSSDPTVKPALDFQYFTDPEGYDAATIVAGLKAAREVAKQEPFSKWLTKEVAPGPKIQTDEELSEYGRRVAHTVYHPAGTTKMGAESDKMAVVTPELRIRGLKGVRIADAGVFPTMPSINPMLTVLAIGERAAEMIAHEAGWRGDGKARL